MTREMPEMYPRGGRPVEIEQRQEDGVGEHRHQLLTKVYSESSMEPAVIECTSCDARWDVTPRPTVDLLAAIEPRRLTAQDVQRGQEIYTQMRKSLGD